MPGAVEALIANSSCDTLEALARRPGRGHRHHGPVVRRCRSGRRDGRTGDALAGKVIVDISNPFNATFDGLAHSEETSIAQEVAKVAPPGASVVKALNTIFVMSWRRPKPNVFIAGDSAQAKAGVKAFIESIGLRPLDVGGLRMAHWLEGVGVVTVGLAGNGVGHWDFALGVTNLPAEQPTPAHAVGEQRCAPSTNQLHSQVDPREIEPRTRGFRICCRSCRNSCRRLDLARRWQCVWLLGHVGKPLTDSFVRWSRGSASNRRLPLTRRLPVDYTSGNHPNPSPVDAAAEQCRDPP